MREVDPQQEDARRSFTKTILVASAGYGLTCLIISVISVVGMVQSGSYGFGPSWSMGFSALAGVTGAVALLTKNQAYRILTTPMTQHVPPGRHPLSTVGIVVQVASLGALLMGYWLWY